MAISYTDTLEYLYAQLPMFTRIGAAALKNDLTNTIALCKATHQPQNNFKSIHIAGTNGKGSTSHMLASILQEAGYKVGLYTSPHIKDFRERIRINGNMICEQDVIDFVTTYKHIFKTIEPSFFEWTVALCFHHFAKHKIDIAVVETGLGGRLDSTNIISPILSVITNIGFDHTDLLGDTLAKIAYEKAGIIKQKTPVVIGEKNDDTNLVFLQKAKTENAPIFFAQDEYVMDYFTSTHTGILCDIKKGANIYLKNVACDLGGMYQQKNILTVLASVENLIYQGYKINDTDIRLGLQKVIKNTGLMGRWQVLQTMPYTVCDTGHNADGIKYVMAQLATLKYNKLHIVFGVVKDKDIKKILALLPSSATYYFCKANLPRALNEIELQVQAKQYNLLGQCYNTVLEAYSAAQTQAKKDDVIFVGGSTFVVAEVL